MTTRVPIIEEGSAKTASIEVRVGDVQWQIESQFAESLRENLLARIPSLEPDAHVRRIKDNNVRAVFAIDGLADLPFLIVKHYKVPDLATRIKNRLIGTKADQEWKGAIDLINRRVDSCRAYARGTPVGSGSSTSPSYVVLEGLSGTETVVSRLRDLSSVLDKGVAQDPLRIKKRTALLLALAQLTRHMLESGVYHRDFHTGNILSRREEESDHLFLIDLHSVRCPRPFFTFQKRRMLGKLFLDLENFTSESERKTFLRRCLSLREAGYQSDLNRYFRNIETRTARLRERRVKSRTRRCIVRSSRFWNEGIPGGRLFYLRSFEKDAVLCAIDAHKQIIDGGSETDILKRSGSGRTFVTRVRLGGAEELCVKEHRQVRWKDKIVGLFGTRGMAEWYASSGFRVRNIPTPEAVALVETRGGFLDRRSFFVTRFEVGADELDAYLDTAFAAGDSEKSLDRKNRLRMLDMIAESVASLHATGAYHNDLKAKNALVHPRGTGLPTEVLFLDLTGVRLWRRLTEKRRIKNLAQLDQSLPYSVSRSDRIRFFRKYRELAKWAGEPRGQIGKILRAGAKRVNYRRQ